MTPGPNGTFRGQATNTSSSSVILKKNGATVSASTGTDYFLSSPYSFVGTANSDGSCDVGRDQHALPSYATVGQSGAFYASDGQPGCGVFRTSSTTVVWSLSADSPTTAWFCLVSSWVSTVVASYTETGTECYKVDQAGNVSAITLAVTVGGETLTFR